MGKNPMPEYTMLENIQETIRLQVESEIIDEIARLGEAKWKKENIGKVSIGRLKAALDRIHDAHYFENVFLYDWLDDMFDDLRADLVHERTLQRIEAMAKAIKV